jgi:hypothetical protein
MVLSSEAEIISPDLVTIISFISAVCPLVSSFKMASVDLGVDEVCLNDLVGFGLFGEQAVSSSSVMVSSSGFRFMVFSFVSHFFILSFLVCRLG